MAKNDIVLLDGILDRRLGEGLPSGERDEVFEYLVFEETLKDYDFSREELESGWVDGRDDGGVDGFFTIVNGHLVKDLTTFAWPRKNAEIEVVILTAKHHATFQQAPINSLLATVSEMFDLAQARTELIGSYSEPLLDARALFDGVYRRLAGIAADVTFRFAYASRGDSTEVAENVRARADQIVATVEDLFSSSQASFSFVGASELIALSRRVKTFALSLPFVEHLSQSAESYVLLSKLSDYASFVTDESGHLRRYLFDSNVRDYLGDNAVNQEIGLSLADAAGPEFWWLNNGVTILATSARVVGKTIQLQDVQIVNGLQTTESVFNHFNAGHIESRQKTLLLKVLVSIDSSIRDQIIRATNTQSLVEPQSLHATDKIQRDIDEILERHDWYYERRKNYYRNVGKPPARFVTPLYIAGGFVGLVLKRPSIAGKLKAKFMKKPASYGTVFSDEVPLELWPVIVDVLKRCEEVLERVRPKGAGGERFLRKWRTLMGLIGVARILGTFGYSADDLVKVPVEKLTDEFLLDTWKRTWQAVSVAEANYADFSDPYVSGRAEQACMYAAKVFNLSGVAEVGRRKWPGHDTRSKPIVLKESFINAVDGSLPAQPWTPRTHIAVAKSLNARPDKVYAAIQVLIQRGRRLQQRDGVVFGASGEVVAVDASRVATDGRGSRPTSE